MRAQPGRSIFGFAFSGVGQACRKGFDVFVRKAGPGKDEIKRASARAI
jgi:hypothetical protein